MPDWLAILKAYVDTLETATGAIEGGTSLHNKLTAARAALLDEITAARMSELDAANVPGDIDGLRTSRDRQLFSMDFWSDTMEEVSVTTVAGNKALPDVTIADLPSGATIVRAVAMFKFRMVENTNAAINKLSGATHIQVSDDTPGTFRDAISIADDLLTLAANTREGGDVLMGDHNIAVEVDGNDTYNFQWTNADADQDNLQFNDIQTGLRIWYSV